MESSEQRKREIATMLLDIGAVTLSPHKLFKWASGIMAPIYCDNRILMSFPAERKKVIAAFQDLISTAGIRCDAVGGVATAGIPHAAWLAAALDKPLIYVRPKAKDHGKENIIEGKLQSGQHVVIIEDLTSTARSAIEAVTQVRAAGGIVEYCLAIFSYNFTEATENFAKADCTCITLTDIATLCSVAKERGIITTTEEQLLLKFSADPRGWQG